MTITQISLHRVLHGNVMDGIADLMGDDKAAIMYCDPPWGPGNLKYWATINRKMTGLEVEQPPLEEFLSAIFNIATQYVEHYLLIEYGLRWSDELIITGEAAGFEHLELIPVHYRTGKDKRPLHLHLFGVNGATHPGSKYKGAVQNTHGYETVQRAIGGLASLSQLGPGLIVLDPCCGMGYTARAALEFRLRFRGNEFNEARLQKTIDLLRHRYEKGAKRV